MYPPSEAFVDTCNQFHLWVFPPKVRIGIGFQERVVSYESEKQIQELMGIAGTTHNSKQRPWAKHHKDDNLPNIGPIWKEYFEI